MKAELKDLITRYENRVKNLQVMIESGPNRSVRLVTKKAVYMNVVRELKQLLEDESQG